MTALETMPDAGRASAATLRQAQVPKASKMMRPILLLVLAPLVVSTVPAVAQHRAICTSLKETPCGEFDLPNGQCGGTSCFVEQPARPCQGSVGDGSAPLATQRFLADMDDYKAGRAMSKISAARAQLQPNQAIVRDVLFTCRVGGAQQTPVAEAPPEDGFKLPEPVEQVYKDVQIRAFDPYGLSTLSEKFDIVVRDTSVLSFTTGVPPFVRIAENEEATGTIGVFGGQGQVTIGMTGAPSWMLLVEDSLTNTSGRNFMENVLANPPAGSAGSYSGIRIVAQDASGRRTESPPFTVEVVAQDALRVLGHQGDIKGVVGDTTQGFVEAQMAKKWISFDVLGGPPGFVVNGGLQRVYDGRGYQYSMFPLKVAGTWSNVVYRAVDDSGRTAYSRPFKVVVSPRKDTTSGLPPVIVAGAPPDLGFQDPYEWTWQAGEDVTPTIEGELPPGLGLCTNGALGICGTPTEFGKWDGSVTLTNVGGGTKTIPFHFENQPSGWLQPCVGRFSSNNKFTIVEDDDSYTFYNAKDQEINFCTPPYNQMDGGEWSTDTFNYATWFKSSSSYDFIFPKSNLPLGYSFYGNALSIPFGDPPPEAMACLGARPFCTDNVAFAANAALGSTAPGGRSAPVYLTGRDWRGRFWGSKKIYVAN